MSDITKKITELLENKMVIIVWGIMVVALLIYIIWNKEKFLNEFRSAPLSTQLDPRQLGIGVTSRFQEFSSTNQGSSHVVGEMAAKDMEHMTGSSEAPGYMMSSQELDEYQAETVQQPVESFSSRSIFSDAFGNPDAKLNQVLRGY